MKISPWFYILAIGGLALWAFSAVRKLPDGIFFRGAKVKFGSFATNGVNIDLLLTYENTNPIGIPIDYFKGSLYYYNVFLADLVQPSPVILAPNASTDLPISANINIARLTDEIKSLILGGSVLSGLRLEGFLTVGGISVEINTPIQVV